MSHDVEDDNTQSPLETEQAHKLDSSDPEPSTTESEDFALSDTFSLHFEIDRTNLNEAWRKTNLPRTDGSLHLELGAEDLRFRTTNDSMHCHASVALSRPSGLQSDVVLEFRTTTTLFEKVLCSRAVHTIVQPGTNQTAEILSFSSSGQFTAPGSAGTSETPCWFDIVDGNLRIRWLFQCTGIRLGKPEPEPHPTSDMSSAAPLRECLDLLKGFAREDAGHPGFACIGVGNQFARAGTSKAVRTVTNAGLGAVKLDLHVKDASPLSSILSAYGDTSISMTGQDQVCVSPSATCSVKRPSMQPPSFAKVLTTPIERIAWMAADELAASIDRIIAQADTPQQVIDVELTPGSTPWLSLSTSVEGGKAVVGCRGRAGEDDRPEASEKPFVGLVFIDGLKRLVARRTAQFAQVNFHPASIELVEQIDGNEVRTFIHCARPTTTPNGK